MGGTGREVWCVAAFELRPLTGSLPWDGGEMVEAWVRRGLMRGEWRPARYDRDLPTHVEVYFAGKCVWVKPVPQHEGEKVLAGGEFTVTFPFNVDFGEAT